MFVKKNKLLLNEEYEAYMKGWARNHNYQDFQKYYDEKFFEDFVYVKDNHPVRFSEMFYQYLNPSFILSDKVGNLNLSTYTFKHLST